MHIPNVQWERDLHILAVINWKLLRGVEVVKICIPRGVIPGKVIAKLIFWTLSHKQSSEIKRQCMEIKCMEFALLSDLKPFTKYYIVEEVELFRVICTLILT